MSILFMRLNYGSFSIIAIHGLSGHRVGSFTASNDVNWLRDLLPEQIPHSRILSYGYDSTNTAKYPHVQEHANDVVVKLVLLRRETEVREREFYWVATCVSYNNSQTEERPIIWIAHGLGGIILKQVGSTCSLVRHARR